MLGKHHAAGRFVASGGDSCPRCGIDQYDGFVVRMGLRSITLAALTGEKINLPNKDLVDKQLAAFKAHLEKDA